MARANVMLLHEESAGCMWGKSIQFHCQNKTGLRSSDYYNKAAETAALDRTRSSMKEKEFFWYKCSASATCTTLCYNTGRCLEHLLIVDRTYLCYSRACPGVHDDPPPCLYQLCNL